MFSFSFCFCVFLIQHLRVLSFYFIIFLLSYCKKKSELKSLVRGNNIFVHNFDAKKIIIITNGKLIGKNSATLLIVFHYLETSDE